MPKTKEIPMPNRKNHRYYIPKPYYEPAMKAIERYHETDDLTSAISAAAIVFGVDRKVLRRQILKYLESVSE